MSSLDRIIDVIESIKYENMPEAVLDKSKEVVADWMGVVTAGANREEANQVLKGLHTENITTDLEQLACWLGTVSRMIDADDGHRYAMGHPGVVVVSTAMAVASNFEDVSGKKLLEAIVRGYEMYCYQGRVINPSAYLERGFDATGVCGAPAAAVVAGTLMGLNRDELKNAVALAATLCGGLNQAAVDGSLQKYILAGWASKLGVMATTLAGSGVDGPTGAYDGRLGYCNAFSPSPDLEYLNNPEVVLDIKYVYTKKYSCVRRIHSSLDAVEMILSRHNWNLDEIHKIDVYGCQFIVQADNYLPKNMAQAQTSIPYAIAILFKYGAVTEALIKENISNESILAIAKKVHLHLDSNFAKLATQDKSLWGAAKVCIMANNEKDEEKVIYPRGEAENPFTRAEIGAKFAELTSKSLSQERAEKLWGNIMVLEKLEKLDGITDEICNLINLV